MRMVLGCQLKGWTGTVAAKTMRGPFSWAASTSAASTAAIYPRLPARRSRADGRRWVARSLDGSLREQIPLCRSGAARAFGQIARFWLISMWQFRL